MDDKTQVLEKTLHIENILKKYIKDSQNSTKIGATNIFLGNYLDSKLKLSRIVCLFVTKIHLNTNGWISELKVSK